MSLLLNVARTVARSAVNGPGERFVVWVQGCSLRCPGCWNPDTWSRRPRALVPVDALVSDVLAAPGVEGVTLTGGEPFDQADPLAELAGRVQSAGLSVMAFTGYELEELATAGQRMLLAQCDIVVTGRYEQGLRTLTLPWRGSSNQRVHFLSMRYGAAAIPATTACEVLLRHEFR